MRAVLRGAIPSDLIVGPSVRGPKIDVLVLLMVLQPKGDANEAASSAASTCAWLSSQIHLNRAIPKKTIFHHGIRCPVCSAWIAVTWIELRPLKVACAIETLCATSPSAVWAITEVAIDPHVQALLKNRTTRVLKVDSS